MKPSIDRKVYCIYNDECILKETVYAVGANSFIISSFGDYTSSDSWEWWYNDYNETWFTNLKKAKRKILKELKNIYPNDKIKLVEYNTSIEVMVG